MEKMLNQSNFFTHNIDIAWKTFVRENCDTPTVLTEEKNHSLAFKGIEAKEAYERIINEKSEVNLQPDRRYYKSGSIVTRKPLTKSIPITEKSKSHQISKEKVTVNVILNAVEQKDLNFLSKYITRENVNSTDDYGWTPLMSAAYCGHLDVIEFLLNLGANRKVREKSGLTAAQLALKRNHLNIVALLKKRPEVTTNKPIAEDPAVLKTNVADMVQVKTGSGSIKPLINDKETMTTKSDDIEKCFGNGTGFYCKICDADFQQTTWKNHETSTLHIFNTKPKLPNTMYGISKHNKGYQMLINHGWDEQSGLGPLGKGIKYPIKTCLKTDRKGLGQLDEKEYRVTHFKSGDIAAITDPKALKPKCLRKKDREKLLNAEVRKERALRMALS